MTATVKLIFEDGTEKDIVLDRAIEASHNGKQSIEFRETDKGWLMYFTKRTFEGKQIKSITFNKDV